MSKNTIIDTALSAAEHPIVLETVTQLESAADQWNQSTVLGLDTEFLRERTYRADLGLVQVSDGNQAWLVDPIKIGSLDTLAELLNRQSTIKLLHSGSEDLEVLYYVLGALPNPLVDTQVACAFLGQPLQLGYHHAVKWLLDVDIDKDQTRSNWLKRPLSSKQLLYAAMDVVLLPMMYGMLKQRLDDCGRWAWLEEEVDRMKQTATTPVEPETAYLRFNRTGRLKAPEMNVLQALAEWREVIASERNLARGFVVSDIALMKLSQFRPSNITQLKDITEIHPRAVERYGEELLTLIAGAESSERDIEKIEELDKSQKTRLDRMRECVRKVAEELAIDPALLASKKELEKLVRALAADEPVPERFMGWRKGVITDQLLTL
jgi:ribonuclease D